MIPWRKAAASTEFHAAPANAKRVLVIKLDGLGPFVLSLAAAKAIRDYHVGARITLLTTEGMKDLAEKCPYFDVIEPDGRPREPKTTTQLITRLRAAKFEVVYDLEASARTNGYFMGLKPWPPLWSGPAQGSAFQYEADASCTHPLDRYLIQLSAAGYQLRHAPLPDVSWLRTAMRDAPRLKPDYFGIRGRFGLILPRGSNADPNRRWPSEKYVELARRIAAQGVTPVVIGGQDEREVGAAIAQAVPQAKNLVTRADVFQAAALAERAVFAVGDDFDLMHVAAAAGTVCTVLVCSVPDPHYPQPRGRGGVVALTAHVVADLPVEQAERQLRNGGAFRVNAPA